MFIAVAMNMLYGAVLFIGKIIHKLLITMD